MKETIRCGLLGYGPNFNMGRNHCRWLNEVPGLRPVAMCDVDPGRVEAARQECPDLEVYATTTEEMLAEGDLDLVVVILPHSLHERAALQCLDAGAHVVMEKPFCLTVEEANRIARRARESDLSVSVFHNRRWDEDYLTIRDVIDRGLIGEVFHVECAQDGYGHPGHSWRADKAVSGGVLYDWGAHFLDWILNLVPAKIARVTGTRHDRVWHGVTNEDYMKVGLRFENGVTAEFVSSRISALPQPKWRILGTLGGLEAGAAREELRLVSYASGIRHEGVVPVAPRMASQISYYRQLADHLLLGEPNPVTPEQARRVIGVIQAAELSAERGAGMPPFEGCE
ncbi:MAG: Gfo/Idh/MocA family oxidoreductase [Spirochaetaceae bacterium]|nr:Gfo/Idh/MocA family oxidoreductase [Spirochaetaceae bacterium]